MTGAIGGSIVGGGMIASLAVAGFDGLGVASAVLGIAFALTAAARAVQRLSARRLSFRALTGRALTAATWAAGALCAACLFTGVVLDSLPGAAAFGSAAALLGMQCLLSARKERRGPPITLAWTDDELAALDDEASLEQLLGKLPEIWREGKFR